MYANTKAFERYKTQGQSLMDFAVLLSYSMPCLRGCIVSIEKGQAGVTLPTPDHFKGVRPLSQLKSDLSDYQDVLGNQIVLSTFSYFDAYIQDAIKEVIAYHGGTKELLKRARARCLAALNAGGPDVEKAKGKLRDSFKSSKQTTYMAATKTLRAKNYKFPGELMSPYGIACLHNKSKNLKAHEMPTLMRDAFLVPLRDATITSFDKLRQIRNRIAHGRRHKTPLKEAIACGKSLRNMAVTIDQHLVKHFLVVEKFA